MSSRSSARQHLTDARKPSLLFGANAIDSDQPSSHPMPNPASTDDGDWETVGDISRQDTLA